MKCNGIDLRKEFGFIINNISPANCLAKTRAESLTFPYIDGSIYKENETFEPYLLEIECTMIEEISLEKLSKLKRVFANKELELEIEEAEGRILKARLINNIDFNILLKGIYNFLLRFEVQPLSELAIGREWIVITKETTLNNLGNYKSKPLIKVSGTGKITLTYNSKTMTFTNVTQPFIVDCELEDVYGESGENLNNFMDINSDFEAFPEGEFTFSYSGATKIEVMPRWREL